MVEVACMRYKDAAEACGLQTFFINKKLCMLITFAVSYR
jgi:hypothetical protein